MGDILGVIAAIIIIVVVVVVPTYLLGTSTVYDYDEVDIITINDIEIGYEGSACEDGLLKFRRAHIRTGTGTGVSLKGWVSPVLCEE